MMKHMACPAYIPAFLYPRDTRYPISSAHIVYSIILDTNAVTWSLVRHSLSLCHVWTYQTLFLIC